jgi:hypothetical protein
MRGLRACLCSWLRLFVQKRLSNVKLTLLAILTLHCHDFWGTELLLMLRGT